jgi:PAS domain S-box-containing protein
LTVGRESIRDDSRALEYDAMDSDQQLEMARCLFRESNDALFVFDPRDQRVVDLNPAALRLSGLSRKAALALRVQDLFTTADPQGLSRLVEAFARTGYLHSSEDYSLIRRAGEPIAVNVSVSRIHTKPEPLGLLVARDVTERRQAQEVLDRFFRLSPALFGILDSQARFLKFNPAWEQALGYSESQLRSAPPFELVHPDDQDATRAAYASLARGELSGFENRCRHKDGGFRWLSWRAVAVDGLIYAVALDITERKRVGVLQQAKEAAEISSQAKDRFLAVLSHELRTPLTPVLMAASALLDDPALSPALRPTMEMIVHNVALEARLIDDLLDLTRIGRGGLRLKPRAVDAHESVREAAAIYGGEMATCGLNLVLALEAAEHHVHADPARLQQIVWNLIQNAVKFTPTGGTIWVRSRNPTAQKPEPDGADAAAAAGCPRLIVEVSDSGIGIEPEILPRIFEAFEQGENALRRRSAGLGLGLAISRSLAEAHGGTLTAASPGRGQGSTFTLELTTIAPPGPEAQPAPATPESGSRSGSESESESELSPPRPLHILLVEDNKDSLTHLALILGLRGHEVRTAERLSAALQAATSGAYDLVISDIELPDGTGLELMQRIGGRAVRGIAMSGYGSEEDVQQSLAAGYDEHLTKPVDIHRLEEAIRRAMAKHRTGQENERGGNDRAG